MMADRKRRTDAQLLAGKSPSRIICALFIVTSVLVWLRSFRQTLMGIAELVSRLPDPVILPIPPSGDETNPYFVNVTSVRQSPRRPFQSSVDSKRPSYDKHHRGYHLVTTNYPWSVVLPDSSGKQHRFNTSSPKTPLLQKTSLQAAVHNCDIVATNGGPFDAGGRWNSGPTVLHGKLIRTKPSPEDSQFVGFGISRTETQDGTNRNWVMGQYGQLVRSSSKSTLWDFVTGFGWLVYDGKPRVTMSHHSNSLGKSLDQSIRAPRTAVGLDKDLNLMVLVVDGCQHCVFRKGLTLDELANLLVDLGVIYAVNMDGGGSSTMVMPYDFFASENASTSFTSGTHGRHNYGVVNRPTCLDLPFPLCQRAVSTVLCVSKLKNES